MSGRHQRHLQRMLLRRAKAILGQCLRLHLLSVTIGQLQEIADAGVCEGECSEAAQIVEDADRLCADIDRYASQEQGSAQVLGRLGDHHT